MGLKLALTIHKNNKGQMELFGYIDKNEIEWLCERLRSLGSLDHTHFHGGETLFTRPDFSLKCHDDEVPIVEFTLSVVDPDDFEQNPFEQ